MMAHERRVIRQVFAELPRELNSRDAAAWLATRDAEHVEDLVQDALFASTGREYLVRMHWDHDIRGGRVRWTPVANPKYSSSGELGPDYQEVTFGSRVAWWCDQVDLRTEVSA